ncbi:MAG: Fic family protein [Bacteroidales bacterium]|nr:Fic family protein [Bacteroidales bacterium]
MRKIWIWQQENWPNFVWDTQKINLLLGNVKSLQGEMNGIAKIIGFNSDTIVSAALDSETLEIIKTAEIEGVILNSEDVRSSVARRLGIEINNANRNHYIEGVVNVFMDAVQNCKEELSQDKLFAWHKALFPMGVSDGYPINVAQYRQSVEPMQVVSGAMGKEKIHYQAPSSESLQSMMEDLFSWANKEDMVDDVLKAAILHLWFVSIHPFDDGNGRIARIITDVFLARADGLPYRFYSMSAEILKERKTYYDILEKTQKGSLDITRWLEWFLRCLATAINNGKEFVKKIVEKTSFWERNRNKVFNERQIKVINLLLDDFFGVLNSSKWAKINKCSQDTALRDINDLIQKDILKKGTSSGRSTNYILKMDN